MTEQSANRTLAPGQRRRLWIAASREIRPSLDPQTRLFWG
jgi:hypothetical protein